VQVAEDGGVELRERVERDPRLVGRAAGDLVPLVGALHVLEDEREPALGLVVRRGVAGRQRAGALELGRELAVERHLAQVGAHADAGRAARRVVRGELDDHRAAVGEGRAQALAHLAGADALDGRHLARLAAQERGERVGGDLVGGADEHRRRP
jgi:hypothetical protein